MRIVSVLSYMWQVVLWTAFWLASRASSIPASLASSRQRMNQSEPRLSSEVDLAEGERLLALRNEAVYENADAQEIARAIQAYSAWLVDNGEALVAALKAERERADSMEIARDGWQTMAEQAEAQIRELKVRLHAGGGQ